MQFEKGYLHHICNQGNNKQKIFFERENYLFFLRKVKKYILPYADILAWCLMPNHFHFMVFVKNDIRQVDIESFTQSEAFNNSNKNRTFNDSIGIMLRSYTRAINKQKETSGALFRRKTKAECINCPNGITPSFITENEITKINIQNPEKQYPQICFDYIHQNPVKAGLVKKAIDWEFSSEVDYAGLRAGKLINNSLAKEYLLLK